jgi:ATP-dependent RNA helicase DeaD
LAEQDLDFFYRLVTRIGQEHELDMLDMAAALTYLSQRERPLELQRAQRPEHGSTERPRRTERTRDGDEEPSMRSYRIEVGHRDGVTPREIVGAIANEAGLKGRHIGRIDIHEDHSILDLPEGMPREVYQHLRNVRVCGRPLELRLMGASRPAPRRGRSSGHKRPPGGRRSPKNKASR